MAEVDEPYIAVLQGIISGEMVAYGEPKVISASTLIEEAKVEAFKNEWWLVTCPSGYARKFA